MTKLTPRSQLEKAEQAAPVEIVSVKRTRKTIEIGWKQGASSFDLCENDNPLPAFITTMDALSPIAGTICHFPASYSEGIRVVGYKVGEQGGALTISLQCRKDIDDAAKEFAFKTPERLLAHPSQEGNYTPPLSKEEADAVYDAIEEAKRYVRGERAQGTIAFEDDDGEGNDGSGAVEPQGGETLPLAGVANPDDYDPPCPGVDAEMQRQAELNGAEPVPPRTEPVTTALVPRAKRKYTRKAKPDAVAPVVPVEQAAQ